MNKRGIATEYLPWILIALAVLVILSISIWVMKDKGISIIENLRGILRR